MKRLFLAAIVLLASLCAAQTNTRAKNGTYTGKLTAAQLVEGAVTVTFSATPTFDASTANVFKLTLTGNVTSSTLSNAVFGQPLAFEICQDATGGRTFVPPGNVLNWTTIPSTLSTCSLQLYVFDGSNALPDLVTATVSAVNGVSFPSSPSTHSVPVVTAANVITYKAVPDCTDTTGNHINYTQSTDVWSCGTSLPASISLTEATAPGGVAAKDILYPDSTAHRWKVNNNNGGAKTLANTDGDTLTATTLSGPTITAGVSQGSGFKHQRFGSICTTPASTGASCTTAVTWTSAFADANYTVACTGVTGTNAPAGVSVESIAASGFTIRVFTLAAVASSFGTVNCIAAHD